MSLAKINWQMGPQVRRVRIRNANTNKYLENVADSMPSQYLFAMQIVQTRPHYGCAMREGQMSKNGNFATIFLRLRFYE